MAFSLAFGFRLGLGGFTVFKECQGRHFLHSFATVKPQDTLKEDNLSTKNQMVGPEKKKKVPL